MTIAPAPAGYITKRTLGDDVHDFLALRPGADRFECFKRIMRANWPDMVNDPPRSGEDVSWNPWSERIYRELCDDRTAHFHGGVRVKVSGLTGAATASKTFSAGCYAFLWWSISPHNSIVILTSTTSKMSKRRIWPAIQQMHDTAYDWRTGRRRVWPFNKVESQTTIQWINPATGTVSDKNAIFAKAVGQGETMAAVLDIRGLHDERILLVIDEMNGTPEAICKTIPNLRKGCRDFQVIMICNPESRMDTAGRGTEPNDGWGSVTEDVIEWMTKGVADWQLSSGKCLRFDGRDSPNVKLGLDKWPFIYTTSDWFYACAGKRDTPPYWSQDRGLHPPAGMTATVFNEVLLEKYDPVGGDEFRWMSNKSMVAFLDPAFGGNKCLLYFGAMGAIAPETEGTFGAISKMGLQIVGTKELTFPHASRDEWDYLVARQTIEECKKIGVRPQGFGLDRTGTGRGVAAIIAAEWSNQIMQIEFGEMASELPSSTADARPAYEVYANCATEMAYSLRDCVEAGQVRGIPKQARKELCMRLYEWKGRKYRLEKKSEFAMRLQGNSCDDFDCAGGLCWVARKNGLTPMTRNTVAQNREWREIEDGISDEDGDSKVVDEGGWSMQSFWPSREESV